MTPADPLRPPDTDEEPWSLASDLAPARGCLLGMALGAVAWTLLILLVVAAWR